jgi:hypothetical protein
MEIEYNFCLNSSIDNLQIHFNPNGLDNDGYNQWISDDNTYSINWDTSLSRWKLNGGNLSYSMYSSLPSSVPPLNSWYILGLNGTVVVNEGVCNPLGVNSLTFSVNQPICTCDGNLMITASGGYPPYQYSIDNGVTYYNSPMFSQLCSGIYSVKVVDISGNTNSDNITLNEPAPPTVYSVKLSTTLTTPVNNNTTLTNQYTTTVSVSPELPIGTVLTFNISHNNKLYYSPSSIIANLVTNTVLYKNNISIPLTSSDTITSDSGFNPVKGCQNFVKYLYYYSETWDTLTFTNSDSIVINTVTTVTNTGPTTCGYTLSEDLYNIFNATISGCGCCKVEIINVNQK